MPMFLYICKHIHMCIFGYVRISPLIEIKYLSVVKIILANRMLLGYRS